MLSKLLGKKSDDTESSSEIEQRVSKMDLGDMRIYVNNKLKDFQVCDEGLNEVMRRLLLINKKTSKRFIEIDAMDVKIKKAFDLVLLVAKNKKITASTVELIQDFMNLYIDIIEEFDNKNKQTYYSKLKKCLSESILMVNTVSSIKEKMSYLESTR